MKTCPTCGARAFDDAEVCFGCLHRYGDEPTRPPDAAPTPVPMAMAAGGRCPASRPEAMPSIPSKPRPAAPPRDGAGWTVRFELPGYAPVVESGGQEGGFVVRFRPSEAAQAGEALRERVLRGTHARDAPAEVRALADAAGCS